MRGLFVGSLSLLVACSSSSTTTSGVVGTDAGSGAEAGAQAAGGSGSVVGTLLGSTVTVADATTILPSAGNVAFTVVIVDFPGVCSLVKMSESKPNVHIIDIHFFNGMPAAQTYDTTAMPAQVDLQYAVNDAACSPTTGASANAGTVTVTRSDSTSIAGSFDVRFASGDHVTGTFDAPICGRSGTSNSTCVK
jgi:hypothetical protein